MQITSCRATVSNYTVLPNLYPLSLQDGKDGENVTSQETCLNTGRAKFLLRPWYRQVKRSVHKTARPEFNDIIQNIADMDADVITIECSRSQMELLDAFADFNYPNEIGPGVYDIHSPRVPSKEEMVQLLHKAQAVIPADQLWVNPDCGLKTRHWDETKKALTEMVEAAKELRLSVKEAVSL